MDQISKDGVDGYDEGVLLVFIEQRESNGVDIGKCIHELARCL